MIGSLAGKSAFALAEKYWTGSILNDVMVPAISVVDGGKVKVTWNATRGMYHKVQTSPNLSVWTNVAPATVAYNTNGAWTDDAPEPGKKYYRIVRSFLP